MKQKALWINQIKGLCICLVVIYHSVITFYPHLTGLQHPLSGLLAKCWVYFNLYLAPFRMPVFFFISGYLIRRYIDEVNWRISFDKRIWSIVWVLALWGVLQWQALSHLNAWLAPERELATSSNAAYADSLSGFAWGCSLPAPVCGICTPWWSISRYVNCLAAGSCPYWGCWHWPASRSISCRCRGGE